MAGSLERESGAGGLSVSRDRALLRLVLGAGPLSDAMRQGMTSAMRQVARDPMIYATVIEGTGGDMFSAGRGAAEMARLAALPDVDRRNALAADAEAAWHLHRFGKPTVALIAGEVSADAAPLFLHGTHRAGGESFALVLPDPCAGVYADCGLAHWLASLPDRIGAYLLLTGGRLGRAEALALGLLTHAIPETKLGQIRSALADAEPVDPVLDDLAVDPGPVTQWPRSTIADCFDADAIREILARLERVTGVAERWARETAARLRPAAASEAADVSLHLLRAVGALGLRDALRVEHGVMVHWLAGRELPGSAEIFLPLAPGAPELPPHYEPPAGIV